MNLIIVFSTCPNDTFIFDALVNGRINTGGFTFSPVLADVEELNLRAMEGELDITKLSYHAFGHVSGIYKILDSGSALGWGNGPLMVSKRNINPDEIKPARLAIPGEMTTANFLTGIAFPDAKKKKAYLFSDIEEVVLSGEADAGVLIHENRFTYADRGLRLILDLGQFWEDKTGMPIPLGGIMVNRRIPDKHQKTLGNIVHHSLVFARDNPGIALPYMKKYAQDMRDDIMMKHVELFVNDYSLSLGEEGRKAINKLLDLGSSNGLFDAPDNNIYI